MSDEGYPKQGDDSGVAQEDDFYDKVVEDAKPDYSDMMKHVADLAAGLKDAEADVTKAEDNLSEAKTRLQTMKDTIKNYYVSLGITKLELSTGEVLEVSEKFTCSQVKDEARLAQAYKWLEAHDGAYLIKKKLEVEELNEQFVSNLETMGYTKGKDFMVKQAVNTASLKSYLAEKLGRKSAIATLAFEDIPAEFGAFIFNEVTIKGTK
jgi:hypothetical protein